MKQFPRCIQGQSESMLKPLERNAGFESAEKSEATMERSVALALYVSKIEFSRKWGTCFH